MENNTQNQAQTIASVMNQINKDGRISKEDVDKLRESLQRQDGTLNITRSGADELFKWKKLLQKNEKIDDSFYTLFIDAICAYLLEDGLTNGVLDESEIKWLKGKIDKESEVDSVVVLLLEKLKKVSINYPAEFDAFIVKHCFSNILQDVLNNEENAKLDTNIKKLTDLLNEHSNSIVDRESIGILFQIKDQINKINKNKKEGDNKDFTELFLNYVSAALLKDAESPGMIDGLEAKWLIKKIACKPIVDDIDKELLEQLRTKSVNFPELLAKILFEKSTKEIRASVANDGNISSKDVEKLEEYLKKKWNDYPLAEMRKAELLFDLKKMTSTDEKKRNEDFIVLFLDTICGYLLNLESKSPGEIDEEDIEWLNGQLRASESRYDSVDEKLLKMIQERSLNFPKSLDLRLSKITLMRILCSMKTKKEAEGIVSINDNFENDDSNEISYFDGIKTALYDANYELRIDDKKEVAEYLFQIKDVIYREDTKKNILKWERKPDYNTEFSKLFVDMILSYLLQDENSLGSIDETEAKWLLARIKFKGGLDDYDVDLLENLKHKSINCPETLVNKKQWAKNFERTIFRFRRISISAVMASLIVSALLFIKGIAHIAFASHLVLKDLINIPLHEKLKCFFKNLISIKADENCTPFIQIIESVDTFLVALVFLIFAIGIYELFIGKFDPVIRITDKRPSWMRISSIDDLKSSLVKVLLIAMIVGFYKKTLEGGNYQELMFLAIGIVLISVAFCIAEISAHYHKKNKEEK